MQRVLIVDDERLVADTLAMVFRKNGFVVNTTYGADEALRVARQESPDLLLCDVTMPGKDGISLAEQMTRELPTCRILFLTAFDINVQAIHRQRRTLPASVVVMTKPCAPEELLRRASLMLSRSALDPAPAA